MMGNSTLALVGGRLIDGTAREPVPRATVIVEGQALSRVGPADEIDLPEECRVIGGAGKTMMPGMMDCHCNMSLTTMDIEARLLTRKTVQMFRTAKMMERILHEGFTTVREPCILNGVGFREAVELGLVEGPRQILGGGIDQTEGHFDEYYARGVAIPLYGVLMADAGAEVIKVERPGRGDPRRSIPPYATDGQGRRVAGSFIGYNRNKKSVVLDLRQEAGRRVYQDLVQVADVVVENLRPGATDKLGLGYEDLKVVNPQLIYAAISGFGRLEGYRGAYANRPAFDIVAEAMGGIMNLVGFADKPPSWTIYGMADVYSGLVTAYGVVLALFMRERTGEGQFVDSAMLDNMLAFNERMVALYSFTGESPSRGKLRHLYPRGAFRCKDGYLALNTPDDPQWRRICEAIGRENLKDGPRTADGTTRAANADFVRPIIENWLADKTRAEAVALLEEHGVPSGPVYTAEDIFEDPHIAARHMLVTVDDPVAGPRKYARTPLHLSSAPEILTEPAPRLGEHTLAVLQDLLGYEEGEIKHLEDEGVVEIWKENG